MKGWWPKTSRPPSKVCLPWVSKRGIWHVPGILPGCPGPWGCSKTSCKKSSCAFFVLYNRNPQNFPRMTSSATIFGGSPKMVSKGPSSRGFAFRYVLPTPFSSAQFKAKHYNSQKTVPGRVRVNSAQNGGHEKATKKPRKRPKHHCSRQKLKGHEKATEKPRKSNE